MIEVSKELLVAVNRVQLAVEDLGRVPTHQAYMMRQHRNENPTLWAAIDELIRCNKERAKYESPIPIVKLDPGYLERGSNE
jgi:hypothetical protein